VPRPVTGRNIKDEKKNYRIELNVVALPAEKKM